MTSSISLPARRRFEALINEALRVSYEAELCEDCPRAFREGVKFCLKMFGKIMDSTTELTEEQVNKLSDKMSELLNFNPDS